jgi:DNA-binding transcriptional LysR family regulator
MLVASPSIIGSKKYHTPNDIAELPMVSLSPFEGERIPLKDNNGNTQNFMGASTISTNNILSVKEAALMGAGMAVMPTCLTPISLDD